QYPQNYFCDRTVTAVPLGASGCEVGAPANVGPVANPDRSTLYVVIPLFANPNPATMCPPAPGPPPPLNCPNHPQDIYVPLPGFGDIPLPAHSHILDGPAGGWWGGEGVVVLVQATWAELAAGKSLATLLNIEARPDAASHIMGGTNLPTNLFLFFNTVSRSPSRVGSAAACPHVTPSACPFRSPRPPSSPWSARSSCWLA